MPGATLDDLLIQLKITNRLLALQLKGTMGQQEMVGVLSTIGASHKDIAAVLDTTPGTVAATLQRLKKKDKKRSQKAKLPPSADEV